MLSKILSIILSAVTFFTSGFYLIPNSGGVFHTPESLYTREQKKIDAMFTPFEGNLNVEIVGLCVVPHTVSGEISSYSFDTLSTNEKLGALLHVFVKNNQAEIQPTVLWNGQTASELLANDTLTWANTPDTRNAPETQAYAANPDLVVSTAIPSGAVDVYTINTLDGGFVYDNLTLTVKDSNSGKLASAVIAPSVPEISVTRLIFNSSADTPYADSMTYFVANNGADPVTVTGVRLYDGNTDNSRHYWDTNTTHPFSNFSETIAPGDTGGGKVTFPLRQRGEILVGIDVSIRGKTVTLMYKVKPIVITTKIAAGWAVRDLIVYESYKKMFTSMHFNTLHAFSGASLRLDNGDRVYSTISHVYDQTLITTPEEYAVLDNWGEPQHAGVPPQRIFRHNLSFRSVLVPLAADWTHEPSFYYYTGLYDYVDFDAYRIDAPSSDDFSAYRYNDIYKDKGTGWWGAPLETIGRYTRTMSKLQAPNQCAAWAQGVHTWSSAAPNSYEKRIQAFQTLANGATSLYWFNITAKSLLLHRDTGEVIKLVNREIATIDRFLPKTVPFYYHNSDEFDFNTNIGDNFALLYITDLNYNKNLMEYVYCGARNADASFRLPAYLSDVTTLYKIGYDGVKKIDDWQLRNNTLTFRDTIDETAIYFITSDSSQADYLIARYDALLTKETEQNFDIYNSDSDYRAMHDERWGDVPRGQLFKDGFSLEAIEKNLLHNEDLRVPLLPRRIMLCIKFIVALF
jgi:hypothetical protein